MALATIGESVASKIIDAILEKASSFLEENLLPAGDTETELERLGDSLPQIKAVLEAVESNQIKTQNKALDAWLWRFRDAVEFAEDVLDELAYYELEEKVQAQNDQVSSSLSGYKRKFVNYVSRKFKDDTLARLVKAVRGLDKVVAGVSNFLNLKKQLRGFQGKNCEDVNMGDDRETGSLLTESVVFGRDKERDLIVEWLTVYPVGGDNSTGNTDNLSAFTILGIGGLGKTTLAQLVCKDERTRQFFDQIIWVCVSDNFDAVDIIIKMLEAITKERPTIRSLASLQEILKERLITKKFLLVLDDVWNDANRPQWENLVAPLKFGHAQSRILVTSRMESVADMVAKVLEGTKDYHKLEGLEENEFQALFNKHAFASVDSDEFKNLHPIAQQIARKLGGCPLAAKIIGGVLNYSMELDYWNKVLKEDVPNFLSGMDDIMSVLRLSYNHLPTNLQLCFRYCSIFPKNHWFKKDQLIRMWMGSGLIEPKWKRYRPEAVGSEYFNRLVRKSFFDLKLEEIGRFSEHYYVMHDLLHDLAISVSDGECLRIENESGDVPKTIRHLQFHIKDVCAMQEITHLKNLRTLCITFGDENSDYGDMQTFNQILKCFKPLRLLSLTGKKFQTAPDAIGELIHLRYLSVSRLSQFGEEVPWLPLSAYRLYHLEEINFNDPLSVTSDGIDKSAIYNLIKLRYLDTPYSFISEIPAIGKLSFLQELIPFVVREEIYYRINQLGSLKSLCKLRISDLEKVNNFQEAREARLDEKEHLKELDLGWSLSDAYSSEEYQQLLDKLRPHINLEMLEINKYGGTRPPVWMTHLFLVNLTKLQLNYCSRLSTLPALGRLPLLKHLTLRSLTEIKSLDHTFYGNGEGCSFPVLKELIFCQMEEWEEWVDVEDIVVFPRLETLEFHECPKLRRLPTVPPSLRNLLLNDVGIYVLPRFHQNISNGILIKPSLLSLLSIGHCRNLISLNGCLLQQQEHSQALTELLINDCFELVHLPSRWFIDLKSLRNLSIENCPELITSSGTHECLFPSSLQKLRIKECGLEMPVLGSLRNLTSLKELSLTECPNLTSLPSADVLSVLADLSSLVIDDCEEFVSLGGLDAITSLRHLTIRKCEKIVALASSQSLLQTNVSQGVNAQSSSFSLEKLDIAHPSLLHLEPLRSLQRTKELVLAISGNLLPEEWLLQNRSSLQSLCINDARNLEHLPASMERMQFLNKLHIFRAQLIQCLPDLPLSLHNLHIFGCHPLLKERYKNDSGVEWYKIARIRTVTLSN